jgi:hypothetical protein
LWSIDVRFGFHLLSGYQNDSFHLETKNKN